jgi:hypothetical protein
MCLSCTLGAVTGDKNFPREREAEIVWPDVTDQMKLLARLRWTLYECTSATTGGPLHIFTDDYNAEDTHIESCWEHVVKEDADEWWTKRGDWDLVRAVSKRILELARPMTEAERCVALSLSWGELRMNENGKVELRR